MLISVYVRKLYKPSGLGHKNALEKLKDCTPHEHSN